jgi:TatD DNase family protein
MPGGADAIIEAAKAQGIGHMLCVSIDLESWPLVIQLAREYDCISASVGIHPNADPGNATDLAQLISLASTPEIIAIGETGLDYFRSQGDLEWQRVRFRTHIRAAVAVRKPLIIHSREAKGDVLRIMEEEHAHEVGGVMHCFVDDLDTAIQAMRLGFYISFSGIVTFNSARELQEVARQVPLDSILVETDAPYLAPVPFRGKQNQPAYVRYVAEKIAALREDSLENITAATTANFNRLFNIV